MLIPQSELMDSLNPNQRQAAEYGAGPLLVIAGAGTGKTKTLAARVAALIGKGVSPPSVLLLTFTRRASAEMLRRAGRVVGEAVAAGVWGGTFHATAHRLIRMYSQTLGLGSGFTVMDQGDSQDLLHLIRTDLGLDQSTTRFPQKGTLLAIYSRCVNTSTPLEQVLPEYFPWCQERQEDIKRVFREYVDRKIQRQLLDYDDLLLYWDQALEIPAVKASLGERFRHVLVDEYQDTNPLQAAILRKLWDGMQRAAQCGEKAPLSRACSLMVVGDDAQSIYRFRGATVENILRFADEFPGAATVTLDQNYRSVQPILDASNAVMGYAKRRFTKNLWSERTSARLPSLITTADELEQCNVVAQHILDHREQGIPLLRQAVLVRTGHYSDALEVELSRRNIPFVKWGGLKFLEAAHIKDLLAFLRILENPRDELSWMRVLQLLDGVGPGRARQAVEEIRAAPDMVSGLRGWKSPPTAKPKVEELAGLLQALSASGPEPSLPAQVGQIRRFYAPIFKQRYDQAEMRTRDLEQLELLAQQAGSRTAFLADLTLDPPVSTGDLAGPPLLDEEYVVISTIHSAKGCEWDVVYLIHASDGVLPSDMSDGEADLEEERRLLYVAMTRARDRLYITFPLRYYHRKHSLGDGHSYAQLSRFLPPDTFPLFERAGVSAIGATAEPTQPGSAAANVQQRLKSLWS
jgi:DNA helicase-2/ATP-dependent DNA helicase PcrA